MNLLTQASGENQPAMPAPPGFPDYDEIERLGRIGLFSPEDERLLRKMWRILQGQTDDYLDMVLGMAAAHPALAEALAVLHDPAPDRSSRLHRLFRQWLLETCRSPYDPSWIRQLYSERVNNPSAQPAETRLPRFRYIMALVFPLATTTRSFLAADGQDQQNIERMQCALLKAILLQAGLLSNLYIKEGLW